MAIDTAVLMCHAPIVIPAVGGMRGRDCAKTTAAMHDTAKALVDARPELLVIVSPHTPRARTAWCIQEGDRLRGDMSRFGAPECGVDLENSADGRSAIRDAAASFGLATHPLPEEPLDHGACVPLWFVQTAGWNGPTVLLALPWQEGDEARMGEAIAKASEGKRWAFLASGDMSHKLKPGAPAGYDRRAQSFDDAFVERVAAGDYRRAAAVDTDLRELAAEDVVQSTTVAAASVAWKNDHHRSLSYEGPFGVGYLEAILYAR